MRLLFPAVYGSPRIERGRRRRRRRLVVLLLVLLVVLAALHCQCLLRQQRRRLSKDGTTFVVAYRIQQQQHHHHQQQQQQQLSLSSSLSTQRQFCHSHNNFHSKIIFNNNNNNNNNHPVSHRARCTGSALTLLSLHANNPKEQQQQPTRTTTTTGTDTTTTTTFPSTESNIYSRPALYDIAFGYRNFEDEVEFLFSKHVELVTTTTTTTTTSTTNGGTNDNTERRPQTILEIAAGPARHAITSLVLPFLDNDDNDDTTTVTANNSITSIPTVYCIDASTEMATYAHQVLEDEMERYDIPILDRPKIRQQFQYQIADMKQFTLLPKQQQQQEQQRNLNDDHPSPHDMDDTTITAPVFVDTVWVLLGSLQHMITNEDVIHCFQCIRDVLHDHGTIFLELPHPRESTFSIMDCTRNGWKVPLSVSRQSDGTIQPQFINDDYDDDDDDDDDDGVLDSTTGENTGTGELSIVWGDDGDVFDPITQVRQFSIRFDVSGVEPLPEDGENLSNNSTTSLQQVVPMRLFTAQEIDALARCAGLKVVAMYGALEDGVDVNDEETSYRLISVLQKQSK